MPLSSAPLSPSACCFVVLSASSLRCRLPPCVFLLHAMVLFLCASPLVIFMLFRPPPFSSRLCDLSDVCFSSVSISYSARVPAAVLAGAFLGFFFSLRRLWGLCISLLLFSSSRPSSGCCRFLGLRVFSSCSSWRFSFLLFCVFLWSSIRFFTVVLSLDCVLFCDVVSASPRPWFCRCFFCVWSFSFCLCGLGDACLLVFFLRALRFPPLISWLLSVWGFLHCLP